MSHPEYPAGNPPEQGSDPWRPGGTYGSASVPQQPQPQQPQPQQPQQHSPPPPPQHQPQPPQYQPPQHQPPQHQPPQHQPTSPVHSGYPTALEPPDPVVPSQPGGVHDRPTTMAYTPGASSPPPAGPTSPMSPMSPTAYPPAGASGWQPEPSGWQPDASPMPPQPARSGGGAKVGLIIVSVVAVLLLGFGGLMTYFWLDTGNELDDTRTQLTAEVESLEETAANRQEQIDGLQGQLDESREDVENLQTQLAGSEGEVEFLQEANDAIAVCLDMIEEWLFIIVVEDDEAAANRHFENELEPACDEADEYR